MPSDCSDIKALIKDLLTRRSQIEKDCAKGVFDEENCSKLLSEVDAKLAKARKALADCESGLVPPTGMATFVADDAGVLTPFVGCRVIQVTASGTTMYITDATGSVPYVGADKLDLYRGAMLIYSAPISEFVSGVLHVTADKMNPDFARVRNFFESQSAQVSAAVNRRLAAMRDFLSDDYADIFQQEGRAPADFTRMEDTQDNPCIMAGQLAFVVAVSGALDGRTETHSLLEVALTSYFSGLLDPPNQVLRRRDTDRPGVLAPKLDRLREERKTAQDSVRVAWLDTQIARLEQDQKDAPGHDWETDASQDEYIGIALGLGAIAKWGSGLTEVWKGQLKREVLPRIVASTTLGAAINWLRQTEFVCTAVSGGKRVVSSRGAAAVFISAQLLTAAEQSTSGYLTTERKDLDKFPKIPIWSSYGEAVAQTKSAIARVVDEKADPNGAKTSRANLMSTLATTDALDALMHGAGGVVVAILTILGIFNPGTAAQALHIGPIADPANPFDYAVVTPPTMTTIFWREVPWYTTSFLDLSTFAAFESPVITEIWNRSLPRTVDKGELDVLFTTLECTRLICNGKVEDRESLLGCLLNAELDNLVGIKNDNMYALQQGIWSWAAICLALALKPAIDWDKNGFGAVVAHLREPVHA